MTSDHRLRRPQGVFPTGAHPPPRSGLAGGRWQHQVLHWRARRGMGVLFAVCALSLSAYYLGQWLIARPYLGGPDARVPVAVLVPLMASALVSTTLGGADVNLERACPRLDRRRRIGHALLSGLGVGVLLGVAGLTEPETFGSLALIRNELGMLGSVYLAATLVPIIVAWAPTFAYVIVVYLAAPGSPTFGSTWWAWPMQDGGYDASWMSALMLFTAGVVAYGWFGPPPTSGAGD